MLSWHNMIVTWKTHKVKLVSFYSQTVLITVFFSNPHLKQVHLRTQEEWSFKSVAPEPSNKPPAPPAPAVAPAVLGFPGAAPGAAAGYAAPQAAPAAAWGGQRMNQRLGLGEKHDSFADLHMCV